MEKLGETKNDFQKQKKTQIDQNLFIFKSHKYQL